MRGGFRVGVALCGVIAAAACGHPRAPLRSVRVPAMAVTARTAAPRRAPSGQVQRLKAHPGKSSDALRIGDKILYVSGDGDRVLMPPGDPQVVPGQRSRFVLPGARCVVHNGDRYGFADESGAIYVTRTPLGPPIARRTSPADPLFVARGGRHAVVGVTRGGTVVRTTDLGRTWTTTAKNALGVPALLAMNHQGQGLLLTEPQAVWATLDDGATWKRVASTGHGVSDVQLGYNGSLWTVPVDLPVGAPTPPLSLFENGVLRDAHHHGIGGPKGFHLGQYLAADRVVLIAQPLHGHVQAALEPLDGSLSPHWQNLPGVKSCDQLRAAAYGATSYVGCRDDSHFDVWSNRGSGPWKREMDFDASHVEAFPLIAGPGGWLFAADHIRPKSGAPAVRVEGAYRDWQSVVVGGVVHLLSQGDVHELYYARATPEQPVFKPVDLGHAIWASLFVDGTKVKVLEHHDSHIVAIDPLAGKDAPTTVFHALDGTKLVLMHGKRGIALVHYRLAETADGGAHWTKIPTANGGAYWPHWTNETDCYSKAQGPSHCTDRGCQFGQDIRLGWSLGGALPAPKAVAPSSVPPVRKVGPLGLVCTLHGPTKTIAHGDSYVESSFAVGGDLRWATAAFGKTVRAVGAFRAGKRFDKLLLGHAPPGRTIMDGSRVTRDALVVALESQVAPDKPVRADVAAFDFKTRRVMRGRIADAGRFSFQRASHVELGFSGGRAWYRGSGDGPVFELDRSGRVTRRAAPPSLGKYGRLVAFDGAPATVEKLNVDDLAVGAGDKRALWHLVTSGGREAGTASGARRRRGASRVQRDTDCRRGTDRGLRCPAGHDSGSGSRGPRHARSAGQRLRSRLRARRAWRCRDEHRPSGNGRHRRTREAGIEAAARGRTRPLASLAPAVRDRVGHAVSLHRDRLRSRPRLGIPHARHESRARGPLVQSRCIACGIARGHGALAVPLARTDSLVADGD